VQWPHRDWWGEGDWLIWTDEDGWPPSYHGTGSEEYFNSGWCSFDRKAVSGFIKTHPGEVALYSFHLNDAFQFQRHIRVAEETFGMDGAGMIGNTIIHRDHPVWGSTAYWYARPRVKIDDGMTGRARPQHSIIPGSSVRNRGGQTVVRLSILTIVKFVCLREFTPGAASPGHSGGPGRAGPGAAGTFGR
jgi:hypothetical protein